MNFEALEWLVKSILSWFKCGFCWAKPEKKDLNVKNIVNNSVEIEVCCEKCKNKSFMKSEVVSIDLRKHLNKEQIEEFKANLSKNSIKDEEIVRLSKDLKKENFSVSDLFEK